MRASEHEGGRSEGEPDPLLSRELHAGLQDHIGVKGRCSSSLVCPGLISPAQVPEQPPPDKATDRFLLRGPASAACRWWQAGARLIAVSLPSRRSGCPITSLELAVLGVFRAWKFGKPGRSGPFSFSWCSRDGRGRRKRVCSLPEAARPEKAPHCPSLRLSLRPGTMLKRENRCLCPHRHPHVRGVDSPILQMGREAQRSRAAYLNPHSKKVVEGLPEPSLQGGTWTARTPVRASLGVCQPLVMVLSCGDPWFPGQGYKGWQHLSGCHEETGRDEVPLSPHPSPQAVLYPSSSTPGPGDPASWRLVGPRPAAS